MTMDEMKLLFRTIDTNANGKISLDEFSEYFVNFITDDQGVKTGNNAILQIVWIYANWAVVLYGVTNEN